MVTGGLTEVPEHHQPAVGFRDHLPVAEQTGHRGNPQATTANAVVSTMVAAPSLRSGLSGFVIT